MARDSVERARRVGCAERELARNLFRNVERVKAVQQEEGQVATHTPTEQAHALRKELLHTLCTGRGDRGREAR